MDIGLVEQVDVLARAVVTLEDLDVVGLNARGLLHDPVARASDLLGEQALPLGVAELGLVQRFELAAEVDLKLGGRRDRQVLVGLPLQQRDERGFESGLALVRRGLVGIGHELRDDRALFGECDRLEGDGSTWRAQLVEAHGVTPRATAASKSWRATCSAFSAAAAPTGLA